MFDTKPYDVVILGGGPAGLSAALWAHSLKLRYLVVDSGPAPGGQLLRVYNRIVDYLGMEDGDGAALATCFREHLRRAGVSVMSGVEVASVTAGGDILFATGEVVHAGFVVVATGIRRRTLGIPGEADFLGRGISPSASRHAVEFSGKRVLVVGGGDAAFEEAIILARSCEHVTLVHREATFPKARRDFVEHAMAHDRISILRDTVLVGIDGSERVEQARLDNHGVASVLPVAGVFICAGVVPNSEPVRDVALLDGGGFIVTDTGQRTSAERIFAAGDVCSGSALTIASATGQGATAVKRIQRLLSASA